MVIKFTATDEFLVNFEATADQSFPRIAALPDGRFVVTWQTNDATQDGDGSAIKARIFNADGTPVVAEFLVNSEFTTSQFSPEITALADGRFVVTWYTLDNLQDNDSTAIKARLFNVDGTPVADEFLVNSEFDNAQLSPEVTALADGRFVVSWETTDSIQDGDGYAIKARLFNADGTPVADEFLVNSEFTDRQQTVDITALSDGRFVATWETWDSTQDGDGYAIKARLFNADGTPVAGEFLVNSEFTANQRAANVTALSDGRFIVTWVTFDGTQDGDVQAIKARLFNADGTPVADEFLVNSEFSSQQTAPAITTLPDGRFLIVWQSSDATQDGSLAAIKAQLFDKNGAALGDEFLVNTEGLASQVSPTVTTLADGRVAISWYTFDGTQDGDGNAIKSIILDFFNKENGNGSANFMLGEDFRDVLKGKGGDDILIGKKGDDDLFGDSGNDRLKGGRGDDKLKGGSGNDTLRGSRDDDDLSGGSGKDKLYGDRGDDILAGDDGKDMLFGKDGDDVLYGGNGKDKLTGGEGDDQLTGGNGKDTFILLDDGSTDEVMDFKNGSDKIDLKAFNFASKADALSNFYEVGTANDDKIAFFINGTVVEINGIDMGQLNNADIII